MHFKPDISIIIPNLHSPIIDRTIESLLQQDIQYSYEIIVVGLDKFQLVDKYNQVGIKNIKTDVPTPPGIARNIGVANANGDYLFFIDADCIASGSWLREHMTVHEYYITPVVVGGSVDFPSNKYITLVDNISTFHEYMTHIPSGNKEQLPSLNLSLPRSIWEQVGGFNPTYPFAAGEDADFTTRIYLSEIPLLFEPKAKITHLPKRNHILDLVNHAYRFGYFSIKGDNKYRNKLKNPFILSNGILSILFSPLMACYVIYKILFIERLPYFFWKTLPLVFFLKIIWCFGIAERLHFQNRKGRNF